MFKIYLHTAIRHLSKDRLYVIINILGLATGITAMLLAILFWRDEESFDEFHSNNPHLYRVITTLIESKDADRVTVGGTGQVQGPAFKAAIPEVRSYTRILGGDIYSNIIANNRTIKIQPLFAERNFLQVFSFPVIYGNAATALDDVASIVLTESTAKKFFNNTDVLGKLMEVDADPSFDRLGKPLVVTAVVKDPPPNSSLQFDALYSFAFMRLSFEDDAWLNAYMGTFLLLEPGADIKKIEKQFQQVFAIHAKQQLDERIKNFGYDPMISYSLQPITDIHFNPLMRNSGNAEGGVINGSDKRYSIVFLVISAFILMMAAINFININLAGSIKRSREVGVRKIAGGSRWQIITQFLIEASLVCLISYLLSLGLVYICLPIFNDFTAKQLVVNNIFNASVLLYFFLLLLVLIVVTGFYPAFILSRFRPAEVLYNRVNKGGTGSFGKLLVIAQFTPAIFLLIATIVYYGQMNYMRTKQLGYNPNQVISTSVYGDRDYFSIIHYLKNELAREPAIKMVSFGSNGYMQRMEINGRRFELFKKIADEHFLKVMEIPLVAGRDFVLSDADNAIIVNEAFVRAAHLDYAIGSRVTISEYDSKFTRTIVGVVKNYHYASPRVPILPMMMLMNKNPDGDMWVKVDQGNIQQGVASLQKVYKKAMPSALFEYGLMDEMNAREFVKESRWQKIVTAGTIISFVICWLGLFGLAHLSTYQRTKEIGIRKVLGASMSQIVMLLTGKFIKLVIIALLIASPLAWMAMNYWLRDYAYHIDIGVSVFIIAAAMAVSVTFISVSYQSFRSALTNPVKSLRTE